MRAVQTSGLPAGATPASRTRYALARELADRCPPELGAEIAVTGSVALGVADDASDLELNLWGEPLPPLAAREAWLREVGATEVQPESVVRADDTHSLTFRYRNSWVEAGWQTPLALERVLGPAVAGETMGDHALQMAGMVAEAVPLRGAGWLAAWQRRLAVYPDGLEERLIAANTFVWGTPHAPEVRWTLCDREDYLPLTERLTWEVYCVLRVLFARNRRWPPGTKWLRAKCAGLAVAPDRLADRINEVFAGPDLRHRVATCQRLVLDTLALLPPSDHVERARVSVSQSLRAHAPEYVP